MSSPLYIILSVSILESWCYIVVQYLPKKCIKCWMLSPPSFSLFRYLNRNVSPKNMYFFLSAIPPPTHTWFAFFRYSNRNTAPYLQNNNVFFLNVIPPYHLPCFDIRIVIYQPKTYIFFLNVIPRPHDVPSFDIRIVMYMPKKCNFFWVSSPPHHLPYFNILTIMCRPKINFWMFWHCTGIGIVIWPQKCNFGGISWLIRYSNRIICKYILPEPYVRLFFYFQQ